jgi:CHASE3 domain sensor protein
MNRERRKQIAAARVLIDKGKALLDEARDMLETVKDDEQAAREICHPVLRTANCAGDGRRSFRTGKRDFSP